MDFSHHPDYKSGKKTQGDLLTEYLNQFEKGGIVDGKLSQDEFIRYYTDLGMGIANDVFFVEQIE